MDRIRIGHASINVASIAMVEVTEGPYSGKSVTVHFIGGYKHAFPIEACEGLLMRFDLADEIGPSSPSDDE